MASFLMTLLWVLFLSNAFNLLDNMDGLSAGCGMACSLNLIVVAIELQQYFVALYLFVLVGALLGFLRYNFLGGKIFLGDSGALFIGYSLAVGAILETFYIAGQSNLLVFAIPGFIFAVPVYDTLSVIVIRLKNKKSIFVGDHNHISHRIARAGYSRKQAVLWVWSFTLLSGAVSFYYMQMRGEPLVPPILALFGVLLLLVVAECLVKKIAPKPTGNLSR
jgi:UDP-GlcNAc:undecaprenyl-phosphate GlcNAc-1-phosphate transferase